MKKTIWGTAEDGRRVSNELTEENEERMKQFYKANFKDVAVSKDGKDPAALDESAEPSKPAKDSPDHKAETKIDFSQIADKKETTKPMDAEILEAIKKYIGEGEKKKPKAKYNTNKSHITISLKAEEREAVERLAEAEGMAASKFIAGVVREYLEQRARRKK